MRTLLSIAISGLLAAAVMPPAANAESLAKPKRPATLAFPFKDLPGVTAPQPPWDDNVKCYTTTESLRGINGTRYRDLPELNYVCEKNGVVSSGNFAPRRGYWQYNAPTH